MNLTLVQHIAIWALPVLLAITLHEAAHGYVAYYLGDPTAKLLGRVTLNPLKHIDAIGTIIVPLALGILSNFTMLFGWAKPVPFTKENFKKPEKGAAIVAVAGPIANLIMVIIWAIFFKLSFMMGAQNNNIALFLLYASQAGIIINLILFILNMLPIPPLDGSKVVNAFLPGKMSYYYSQLEPYGLFILIALLVTGVLNLIIAPIYQILIQLLSQLFSL